MTAKPVTLEYSPQRDRSVLVFYVVYLLMICLPAGGTGWMIYSWVPRFRVIFMDFRTTLPDMTMWLMRIADWCQSPLVWPLLIAGVFGLPWILAKLTLRFKNAMQRLTAAMMIMMVLMFVTFSGWMIVQVALFLPLMKLVKSVSGGAEGE